jgi:23S rRNA (pseudouridine1915-N3)-methyltransferase
MKMTLLTVGKTDVKCVREGLDLYASRLVHYVPFNIVEIPELKGTASLSHIQIKEKEGKLILKAISPSDRLLLLDERGKEYRSIELADKVQSLLNGGKDIVFAIGGAYGFSDEVYSRSNGMLALSKMTFSHQMARVIFAEQLYRAFTIIKGDPYHHEG